MWAVRVCVCVCVGNPMDRRLAGYGPWVAKSGTQLSNYPLQTKQGNRPSCLDQEGRRCSQHCPYPSSSVLNPSGQLEASYCWHPPAYLMKHQMGQW